MPTEPTVRETSLALVLGASEWPLHTRLGKSPAFKASAQELQDYLEASDGLSLPAEQVKSLFDLNIPADEMLDEIRTFIAKQVELARAREAPVRNLLIFYIGHGGFSGEDYYLAIRRTRDGTEGASSLRVRDLAHALKEIARPLRRYIILDCCFAASAVGEFQSGPVTQVVRQRTLDAFPGKGTALLCAASAKAPARTPEASQYTMFGGALLDVLKRGDPEFGPALSLEDLGSLLVRRLRDTYLDEAVRPEVHSPDQREGDIADLPLFPNMALKPRTLDARVASVEQLIASVADETADTRKAGLKLEEQLTQAINQRFSVLEKQLSAAAAANVSKPAPAVSLLGFELASRTFGFSPEQWARVPSSLKKELFRYRSADFNGWMLVALTLAFSGLSVYTSLQLTGPTEALPGAIYGTCFYAGFIYLVLCIACGLRPILVSRMIRSAASPAPPLNITDTLEALGLPETDSIARMQSRRVTRVVGGLHVMSPHFEAWLGLTTLTLLLLLAMIHVGGANPVHIFLPPQQ